MEPTSIDFVLLFLILAGGMVGLLAGAVQVVGPLALVLALLSLAHAYPGLAAHFGTGPAVPFFLLLLLGFSLLVYGVIASALHRVVHASGLGPLNRLLGAVLGLITGTLMAGMLVWGVTVYGGQASVLLDRSVLAPAVWEFFQVMLTFTGRLFPQPEPAPWWKRPWW